MGLYQVAFLDPSQPDSPEPPHTVGSWLAEWLSDVELSRPRSHSTYAKWVRHIVRDLGDLPLAELRPAHVRQFLASKVRSGRLNGTSVQHTHRIFRMGMEAAVRQGLLPSNPVRAVPKPANAEFEAATLTEEEAVRLLETCSEDRLGALVVLALHSGMREGELLALTWRDVDFDTATVRVTKSVAWLPGRGWEVGPTKTRWGRRTLSIEGGVVAMLREHQGRQAVERLAAKRWIDNDLVFPTTAGTYLMPSNLLNRYWYPLLVRAGVPRIRFHDLRHTAGMFITRLASLVVASRMLGHSSVQVTGDFYGHAQREDYRTVARDMGALLRRRAGGPEDSLSSRSIS